MGVGHHCLAWVWSCSSECVGVIRARELITTVGRSAWDSQRGSFMISPICSPTLSAEALVTLPNTCKPSGFPTTAKTIVSHCGWCYKERRKTLLGGGGWGVPTCPCDSCGFIHKVWSFNWTWNGDIDTVALGETSTVASSSELFAHQLLHAAATLKQKHLWTRGRIGYFVKKKKTQRNHRCSSSSWLAASWTALPLDGHVGMTPCEVSVLSFLFPMLVYVATTTLYFFGFNSPPWNYRKVIWWCVTWASIGNNASREMGETSQKAECFVCHIHTELFFPF